MLQPCLPPCHISASRSAVPEMGEWSIFLSKSFPFSHEPPISYLPPPSTRKKSWPATLKLSQQNSPKNGRRCCLIFRKSSSPHSHLASLRAATNSFTSNSKACDFLDAPEGQLPHRLSAPFNPHLGGIIARRPRTAAAGATQNFIDNLWTIRLHKIAASFDRRKHM